MLDSPSVDGDASKGKTLYDRIYDFAVQAEKPINIKDIQDNFQLDEMAFRNVISTFTNAHVFEVKENRIMQVNPPFGLVRYENVEPIKVLREEQVEWRGLAFHVQVVEAKNEAVPVYYIPPLKIGNGVRIRLKCIFNSLSSAHGKKPQMDGEFEHPTDSSRHLAQKAIEDEFNVRPDMSDRLSDALIYEFAEVGCLSIFLADRDIEEIVFNGTSAASLYSCTHGWLKTNVYPTREESLFEIATRMARVVQKEINFSNPIVETRLQSGDRVSTLLNAVAPQGTIITIRKFFRNPTTIVGLIKELNSVSIDIAALLWFAVEYELNILVAGGSGSGKTTLLNAVCNLIPSSVHVLSIESLREIHIPESRSWNWLSLQTREDPNVEPITSSDLMAVSLKMRPERIILGEAVRPEDIRSLFQAMQVGHPVFSTIHATTSNELIRRVMDPAYGIPKTDISSIDLVVVMYHDVRERTRKILEVSEIRYESNLSEAEAISHIYRYSQKSKTYLNISKPRKIFEKVSMKTGMTAEEMETDIGEKKKVIQWAIDRHITQVKNFEMLVQEYYSNRKALMAQIQAENPGKEQDAPQT
ncbi:MAG: type II/IV secretion system ATPase subunit [Candidatus Altiarchaeota archaeon]